MAYTHTSVLLQPAVQALLDKDFSKKSSISPNTDSGVFVDGTFGRGGHSREILSVLGQQARLIVFDKDPQAITIAQDLAQQDSRLAVVHNGFATLGQQLDSFGLATVSGILLDLGVSSPQIDDAQRGFSFMRDGPLDMRMDTSRGETAAQWLARADLDEIKEVIANYGEERYAFQIAKALVACRESRPLCTTNQLAELVASVVRAREKGQHPATRTFQAIRIHINAELEELAYVLATALSRLENGGRLVVISFHSLEDRMVKQCFAAAARPGQAQARLPILEKDMPKPYVRLLGKFKASSAEVDANVRARSAVMRVIERTAEPLSLTTAQSFIKMPGRWSDQQHRGR